MTRNCARVFVAAVWSRCWPDFPRYSRLLKSRLTRPGAIWECANWGKNRVASGLYNRRAAMSSSPMRTLAVAEITGQAHKLRAGARCDCRKRTVKGRYARRRHLQSLDKIICAEDYAHFVERRRPIPLSFRVSARGNSCTISQDAGSLTWPGLRPAAGLRRCRAGWCSARCPRWRKRISPVLRSPAGWRLTPAEFELPRV